MGCQAVHEYHKVQCALLKETRKNCFTCTLVTSLPANHFMSVNEVHIVVPFHNINISSIYHSHRCSVYGPATCSLHSHQYYPVLLCTQPQRSLFRVTHVCTSAHTSTHKHTHTHTHTHNPYPPTHTHSQPLATCVCC